MQESIVRNEHRILDLKTYIDLRRLSSGVKPMFSIYELGFNIPDEVMAHPAMQDMIMGAVDMIAFSNVSNIIGSLIVHLLTDLKDIFSYNVEQHRKDEVHNIITCVMKEHQTDVNGAMLWVQNYLDGVAEKFLAAFASLPQQWEEPLNSEVKAYCEGLGQWVRGNNDWSFESERYFGNKGAEIKEKRWMSLLPRKRVTEIGPVHVDSSLL